MTEREWQTFEQQARVAATTELLAEVENFDRLPESVGLRPAAIVTWYRDHDNTFGTHCAYLDETFKTVFITGHYDFPTYAAARNDAVERVERETRCAS